MFILRFLWAFLTSRWLWTLIGLALLSLIVWMFGPLVGVGDAGPSQRDRAPRPDRALVLVWLVWLILAQRRAIRANRLFVSELAAPASEAAAPGEEASPPSARNSRR